MDGGKGAWEGVGLGTGGRRLGRALRGARRCAGAVSAPQWLTHHTPSPPAHPP